jgi:hypothetical protein
VKKKFEEEFGGREFSFSEKETVFLMHKQPN